MPIRDLAKDVGSLADETARYSKLTREIADVVKEVNSLPVDVTPREQINIAREFANELTRVNDQVERARTIGGSSGGGSRGGSEFVQIGSGGDPRGESRQVTIAVKDLADEIRRERRGVRIPPGEQQVVHELRQIRAALGRSNVIGDNIGSRLLRRAGGVF